MKSRILFLAACTLAPLGAQIDLDLANDDESFEFRGGAKDDHLGGDSAQCVRTIVTGDFNGDGIDDYAIASYDAGSYGTVVLKFGTTTWSQAVYNIANVLDVEISGEVSNNISECLGVGDLNDDGIDDLIIGADRADRGGDLNVGAAHIFFGSGSWTSSLALADSDCVIWGWSSASYLPSAIACGDFDGDGIDDLALGARSYSANTGRVVLFEGSSSWPALIDLAADTPDLDLIGGETGSGFGGDVWFADVDADGDEDLFTGAQDQDLPDQDFSGHAGYVFGFHGGAPADTTADFEASGVSDSYGFGQRGAGGDFNGDGYDDIVVLATDSPSPKAVVFLGSATGLTSSSVNAADAIIAFASQNSNGTPSAVAAGDFDNDGYDDFCVGISTASPEGRLFAGAVDFFFGRAGWDATGTERDFTIAGAAAGEYAGQNVCFGDVNDDGYDDLILNTPYAEESGRRNSGQVETILGRGYEPVSLEIQLDGDDIDITVCSRSGRTVTLESATDLAGPWTEVDCFNTGREDDPVSDSVGDDDRRFYRASD